jgi:hypothetical protein
MALVLSALAGPTRVWSVLHLFSPGHGLGWTSGGLGMSSAGYFLCMGLAGHVLGWALAILGMGYTARWLVWDELKHGLCLTWINFGWNTYGRECAGLV